MERNTSFAAFLAGLASRIGGPGTLRFVLQPLVAILLGVRDGRHDARRHDARARRPPYLWAVLFYRGQRRAAVKQGALAIAKPFVIAIAVDAVLSYTTLGAIYPGETLVVGCLLVALPYAIARAATGRLLQRRRDLPVAPPSGAGDA
jgi:hypothetical protein